MLENFKLGFIGELGLFSWLPPGGSPRGAGEGTRVKKRFLRILFLKFRKYSYFLYLNRSCRKAPSVTLRVPPPSRREAKNDAVEHITHRQPQI